MTHHYQARMRAALYIREEFGPSSSVEAQQAALRDFVQQHHPGWRIVGTYYDTTPGNEALSRRPGLRSALRAATAGEFDVLIAPELNRINRRMDYFSDLAQKFDAVSVALLTADSMIDTTTPVGRLLITILASVTTYERLPEQERAAREA
ncbi:recombinase family protein [Catellatospora citrea]|uniref:Resolvase/invertase-type recombinase catalytic domain-containing protein n=1 Tax=Catellatospora citrea TaxID=53366 RepID=A0A8J3KEK6_9ACTN|nr:recombinase family protein [Catellatospora citrea]RKE07953.1 resolvase-like protein [Catellatospora citrea]GIF98332.1 hypothetical protein Cci01nite_34260 [Catellatospora citrea]